ncbi:DinB family protein [Priestia abyssalis]|uniref:DinB family protein n=1 Tax=Priestia abyssalis TaxID=1221450 RepID=UPI0009956F5F|nr:DinB family protein [Priestia abyssalis]
MSAAQNFTNSWLRHRLVGNEIVDMVSDEHLNFRPWDKAMTLKELVLHMLFSADMFTEAVKQGAFVPPAGSQPEVNTAEELKQLVHEVTAKTRETMESLSEDQFSSLVDLTKLFGTQMPGKSVLHVMRDHEIHHKGQLFVYARMIGLENLPMFVKKQL